MENTKDISKVNEKIAREMIGDKEFCLSIINCKDRAEVKAFLASHGINANDNDIDVLAQNISEVADICKKLDEKDLENISGGVNWGNCASKASLVVGISAIGLGVLGILSLAGVWIKKIGEEKGWWAKHKQSPNNQYTA